MNQVRTTITLPEDTHQYLLMMSIQKKKSLGELIETLVKNKNYLASQSEVEKNLAEFRALCHTMAKKIGKVDWAQVIREERDRDDA